MIIQYIYFLGTVRCKNGDHLLLFITMHCVVIIFSKVPDSALL